MLAKEVIRETDAKMKKTIDSLLREFSEVRTGRASPELVENLHIDYYGASTPLKQIAAVSSPDPRLITIQPWDANAIIDIEKAVLNSKLGVSPANDGKLIRLSFPQLSQERRVEMVKVVKEMAEKGRVSLRTIRRDGNEKIKKMQSDSSVTEDDSFRAQDEIQKMTDRYIKEIDQVFDRKSHELKDI